MRTNVNQVNSQLRNGSDPLHGSLSWEAVTLPAATKASSQRRWCVLDAGGEFGATVARSLHQAGHEASVIPAPSNGSDPLADAEKVCVTLIELLGRSSDSPGGSLWLVTRGAQGVLPGEHPQSVVHAAAWALAGSAMREPSRAITRVDLPAEPTAADLEVLRNLPDSGGTYAIRGGGVYRRRLAKKTFPIVAPPASKEAPAPTGASGFSLRTASGLKRIPRAPTRPGEVEIEVLASSLDRVSLAAADGWATAMVGWGCVGQIATLGEGVRGGLKPGQRVAALVPGSASRFVTVNAALVAPLPDGIDPIQGAAHLPSIVIASHALQGIARLRPGDHVLVLHAASPVGIAAIHLARRVGASVTAEESSAEGRAWLAEHGVPRALDGTRATFRTDLLQMPRGNRINVVIDAGTGPIDDLASILASGAHYIEIVSAEPAAHALPALDLAVANLDPCSLMLRHPQACASMLRAAVTQLHELTLPPAAAVACADAPAHLRDRAGAASRPLAALSFEGAAGVFVEPSDPSPSRVRSDGAYLVAVRAGDAGLRLGRWLAERGAGAVVFVSPHEPGVQGLLAMNWIERAGTKPEWRRADLSEREQAARTLETTPAGLPWRGVVVAASAHDDHENVQLTADELHKALSGKPRAAENLFRLTEPESLDFFVLLSSLATDTGLAGFASAAAADAATFALLPRKHPSGCPVLHARLAPLGDQPDLVAASVGHLLETAATDAVIIELSAETVDDVDGLSLRSAHVADKPRPAGAAKTQAALPRA